jgi:PAS domain S-box-containing protein
MSGMTGRTSDTIRVLHVDDEPDFAELAATFLEREDDRFEVETATDASEGLAELATATYDCIVSDHDMPGQNGIEFLQRVREEDPDIPFILYTGKGSEEVASDAISAGVTEYLQKEGGTSQYTVLANRIRNAVEKYHAQTELADREKRLNLFFEQSPLGVVEWDEDFNFVRLNDAAEGILGYSEDELVGRSWDVIVPESDREPVDEVVSALLENSGGYRSVNENVRGNGERIVCEWHNRVVTDDDGEVVAIFSQFQDITEENERKAELRRSERRYEAIFNDPNILVGLLDTDGTVLDINETAMEYVEPTLEDVRDEPFWETPWFDHSTDVQQDVKEWIDRAAAGEYVDFEVDLVRPGGDPYTIEGVFRPVTNEDGEVVSLLISDRDITERKERERDLQRYEAYLQESTDIITVLDADGTIKYQSPAVERILGYEAGALLGRNGFDFVHPDDVDEATSLFADLTSDPGSTITVEFRFRTADGEWRWLEVRGTNQLENDAIEGIVTNNRDITERKARERALQRERDRLDEFASVVSHDLRNPLNVIEGRLELLCEDCDSDHLDSIATAVDRMDRIIEDVLWLAREGRDVGSMAPTDLRAAVDAAWELAADGADGAELCYATDDRSLPTIRADDDRLHQLLENLLGNAIDHGGEDVTVTVGALEDGFYVADDGPGIPEDDRDRVFAAGYSTGEEGTGFGLSIVEGIADAHGWEIEATESEPGGARFEIRGVDVAAS